MSGRNDPSIREVAAGLSGVSLVLSSAQFWFGGREALSQSAGFDPALSELFCRSALSSKRM
jgi:hypothetical protein